MTCASGCQTGGLRERVLLRAQIAGEDRRARRRDPLQTLLRSERDPAAADALEINRGRLALLVAQRYGSFPEQWQSHTMLADLHRAHK